MNQLLFVTSSLFPSASQSQRIGTELVAAWQQANPKGVVVARDLTPETMPHLGADALAALMTPAEQRDTAQRALVGFADSLIEEVEAADTVVLTAPMYNFSIPSTLKAWIDHVSRAGRTFRYSAAGPEGMLTGKKVIVVTARGGYYAGDVPAHGLDFQEPYLRGVLGFLGLTDVQFVHVEGVRVSADAAAAGIVKAQAEIATLFPVALAA